MRTWFSNLESFSTHADVQLLRIPEGARAIRGFAKLFLKGESAYDALWRYVKRVNKELYRGQTAQAHVGEYTIGLRGPDRVPAFVDFRRETVYVGKKLTIPFNSLRGLMVAHGMMPWRKMPVFVLLLKVDGCHKYLPLHQCSVDLTVVDLADFLSTHMRIPLGISSFPLHFYIPPGSPRMTHAKGETPLFELRGLITVRTPDQRTRISMLTGAKRQVIVEESDPNGWIESWGVIADDLVSIVARRAKSRYGRDEF